MRNNPLRSTLFAACPALLLASVMVLPWLNKAHTTDDTTFLLMAEHALKDPLHPTAFEMVADGNHIRLSSRLVSGPVMAYLLLPCVLLGSAEWAAHLVQYLLMLAAILATVSLAFRLGLDAGGARIAGLLLASTPAVMVMATTSMADVPAMAFAVLGVERYFAWREHLRWHQGVLVAILFALSALSRPHLILILAVVLALECAGLLPSFRSTAPHAGRLSRTAGPTCWERWRLAAIVSVPPLAVSIILIISITILTSDPLRPSGDFLNATISRFHPTDTASNLAAFLIHWSLVFPLALLWFCLGLRWRNLWRNPAVPLSCIVALLIWILDREDHKVPSSALALSFIGAFVLIDILIDSLRKRDTIQLFLGLWLLIALPVISYVQLPCKYLVPSAPAMSILLACFARRVIVRRRIMTWVAVSAGLVLSFFITAADAQYSSFGRCIAAEQIAPRVRQGIRVWANGEWGFEWYALKAGAIPVAKQPPFPTAGDVLVSTSVAPHVSLELPANRQMLATFTGQSRFGRIMDYPNGIGFYSNGYGYLPWSFRNGVTETIHILKIQ